MNATIGVIAALSAVMLASGATGAEPAAAARTIPTTISPEAQAFLQGLPPRRAASANLDDPAVLARLRQGLGSMFLANARKIRTDYTLEPMDAGGAPAYWVRTPDPVRKRQVLLYIHGGGFILGSAKTDLSLPLRIGPLAELPVLSVDYRLAPEHPFPAAVDDVLAAYRWLLKSGYRAQDIGVLGDSAGGALTLSLVLAAREAGLPLPGALVVLSPVTDLTGAGDTRTTLDGDDPLFTPDASLRWAAYLGGRDPRDPIASPVFANLRGLPPLLIQVGTREILLSDSVRLARVARVANVDVTLDVWDGMWHVWQGAAGVPEAEEASREIAGFLTEHLGRRSPGSG